MSERREGLLALCLFALLFSVYLLTFSGIYHSSDEMAMLVATDSLARRGAWDIELLRWMGEQQGSYGPDGLLYSRKGIGTTLAALPHYWLALQTGLLGNVQMAMLTNGAVTALTGALAYLLLRRLKAGPWAALGVGLAFGLGTMAWPYARYLFSEPLAGLGLIACAYFVICLGQSADGANLYALLAGAGLGVALLARLNNALVAPFLGLLLLTYLYRRHRWDLKQWIAPVIFFGLPVLAALAISGWYNWIRFGNPLTTGYLPEERFATPFFEGFYGLLLSPGKGLLWYNPILFASLAAWPSFFRRHRAEALLVAAVVLSNVAFYAPWYLWWAGHAWGPRFLVTILPFAILPLAPALEAAARGWADRRRALATGLGILFAISVAVQILGVAVDFNLYLEEIHAELGLYHPATLFDPAYSPLLRQVGYLRLENLDLAWARGGTIDWLAVVLGMFAILVSAFSLLAVWRSRPSVWTGAALPLLLGLVAVRLLLIYAPGDDMAQAARMLATMEKPGEAAALTEPLSTGAFQDAYDGRMWVWGVPDKGEVGADQDAVWAIGAGDPEPAGARFQAGAVRMDYYPAPGTGFDTARLPVPPRAETARLGEPIELLAIRVEGTEARPGEALPVWLTWRALASMEVSYTIFVQAVDAGGIKAGQVDRQPCNGGCPTSTWRPGDLVGERYDLTILTTAPPGDYRLIAGMYDLETGENLIWTDAQGNEMGTYLSLGTVTVATAE